MPHSRPLPPASRFTDLTLPTPLVPLALEAGETPVWCKLEFMNPSGSTKDRIAAFILKKAWRRGEITRGDSVVEASSGSTSIAMALVCAHLGLKFVAVMPESVSRERSLIIRSYGGQVEFSPAAEGIRGAMELAERIAQERGAFFPRQFENPDNAAAHRFGTAREIMEQMPEASVDAVVSGVGTGGTLVGLYSGLRDLGCQVVPYVARPVEVSPRPDGKRGAFRDVECCSFSARIPGVVDRMSKLFRPDELEGLREVKVDDQEALEVARLLIARGFPVGPSSGLNYVAARQAVAELGESARVVTVFPDRMERYFSTDLFPRSASPSESPPSPEPS